MSEPTYLIRLSHEPTAIGMEWGAEVTRIADGSCAVVRYGSTQEEAVRAAQAWMRAEHGAKLPGRDLYAQEDGTLLVGESVRVLRSWGVNE